MKISFERAYPYILALVPDVVLTNANTPFPSGEGILSAGITVGAIFTGFLATNKAIILTLNSPVMIAIRKSDYFLQLISYLREALWISLLFSILSVIGFFVKTGNGIFALLWIFLGSATVLTFFRVTQILFKICECRTKE